MAAGQMMGTWNVGVQNTQCAVSIARHSACAFDTPANAGVWSSSWLLRA
jgi:hypothetical protein